MGGIVICAYGDVGYRCTKWLLDAGEPVRLVYTHPDAPGEERWWESVADLARSRAVPVKLVGSLDAPSEEAVIRAAEPDVPLLLLLPEDDPGADPLDSREGGPQHARLPPPAFRGRSPVNWAI